MSAPPLLQVDHASLRFPDLERALEVLDRRLGLRPTRTPGAEARHSRLFFDRSYLEVAVAPLPPEQAGRGELFFFRFPQLQPLIDHLTGLGVEARNEPYQSIDGLWDNLELGAPAGVPAPILVRRLLPVEVAADWPPRHPGWDCGARTVLGFQLQVPALPPAARYFQQLLGAQPRGPLQPDPLRGLPRLDLDWAGGTLTLLEAPEPGLEGVLLATDSVEQTARFLQQRGTRVRPLSAPGIDELWVDLPELPGLRLGFARSG